jgi:threonine/homoserine/homoserine lactone efflux protein
MVAAAQCGTIAQGWVGKKRMDALLLILGGVMIGVMVAAPIGPVNLICIRRTLTYSPLNGFLAGLGAALGDGVFAVIAGFGLTAAGDLIDGMAFWLQMVSAILLIVYGVAIVRAVPRVIHNPDGTLVKAGGAGLYGAIASTFALTVTNPATMVGFAAFFAIMKGLVDYTVSAFYTFVLVVSVVLGSALWWAVVTGVTSVFRKSIEPGTMRLMNVASGGLILATGVIFAVWAIGQRVFGW